MPHDGMNQVLIVFKESKMLKEVGASGQISLGKKYAGRLFDVVFHDDERFELFPMKVVPQGRSITAKQMQSTNAPDGWVPPGGYTQCSQWALDNREALTAYAQQISDEGTAAEQLEKYLAQQSLAN
jgi:hypothetical protein